MEIILIQGNSYSIGKYHQSANIFLSDDFHKTEHTDEVSVDVIDKPVQFISFSYQRYKLKDGRILAFEVLIVVEYSLWKELLEYQPAFKFVLFGCRFRHTVAFEK